ncbi:Ribokinase-like protein [Spinellus fusiger]|nr:Ribokinase-like protein [Spinellus fusiger]
MTFKLIVAGNPLLDIQCVGQPELLEKYDLKANSAILAEDSHKPLYQEIVDNFEVSYVAGGSSQNTARGAQYLLPADSTVYFGGVSDDVYASTMQAAAVKDGLATRYMVIKEAPTGTCAVLINDDNRSLIANLAAAEKFQLSHVEKPENWALVEAAQYFYSAGFFITHDGGYASSLAFSKHASENNKIYTTNLSAPFISMFFKDRLDAVLFNTDILFGNEDEALTYAAQSKWETKDIKEIASKLSKLPKSNDRPRTVVITQGALETVVAVGDDVTSFPVAKAAPGEIVDANGAGDGFCGGFLGLYVQGIHDITKCVNAGHYLAGLVIRREGPTYPPMAERGTLPTF